MATTTTTRRAMLGATFVAPLAAAILTTPASAESSFVEAIAALHPAGRNAANKALAAGMRPEWLYAVTMPNDIALLFDDGAGNLATFYGGRA